jgi:hypothetical protein
MGPIADVDPTSASAGKERESGPTLGAGLSVAEKEIAMDITRAGEGLTGQDGGSGSRGSSFYRLTNGFPTLASYARPRDPQGSLGTPVAHEVRHFLRNQYVRAYQSYPHNLKVVGSNPTPATIPSIDFWAFPPSRSQRISYHLGPRRRRPLPPGGACAWVQRAI